MQLPEKYADIALKMIALLTGIFLFFPSIFDFIKPPYVGNFFVLSFWCLGFIGICVNAISFYNAFYRNVIAHEAAGIANICTVLAIFSFAIFLFLNIINDKYSAPSIINIEAQQSSLLSEKGITFSADVSDQNQDLLTWNWTVEWKDTQKKSHKTSLGHFTKATWKVPQNVDSLSCKVILTIKSKKYTTSDTLTIF